MNEQPNYFPKNTIFLFNKDHPRYLTVAAAVALVETGGRFLLYKTSAAEDVKNVIIAIADSTAALAVYEPAIFGAINPGNTIERSLFTAKISGVQLITGGKLGPQNSIQALIIYIIAASLFLWQARRRNNFIQPYWKNHNINVT